MSTVRAIIVIGLALITPACEKAVRDMYDQPRDKAFSASSLFANGQSARPLAAGVVPYSGGAFAGASSGRASVRPVPSERPAVAAPGGGYAGGHWMPTFAGIPVPLDRALLERGRQRYDIYCAPCHGVAGDADGMIVRRGFAVPPTYHSAGLRNIPDFVLYDVITNGIGAMFPYGDRIAPEDRWAIVAYIRALQFSQFAPVDALEPADEAELARSAP